MTVNHRERICPNSKRYEVHNATFSFLMLFDIPVQSTIGIWRKFNKGYHRDIFFSPWINLWPDLAEQKILVKNLRRGARAGGLVLALFLISFIHFTPPDTWFRPPFRGACICSECWGRFSRLYTDLMTVPNLTFTELRGFHGAFATGVASQQGALTLPDTWFRPQFWDLLMLQLLRPNSSNLSCLYSTFHLEYPLVLSRFCLCHIFVIYML